MRRLFEGAVQVFGLIQGLPFFMIADDIIEFGDQCAKINAMTVDAERVRQRNPCGPTAAFASQRRCFERLFSCGLIKKIALKE